ncbi:MAG: mannose-1-phosphate guanylyltransferase [Myxococcales bacterium]|nr:mannose-1-phosphate guanylyltransferase [Myxococcales bacterium]
MSGPVYAVVLAGGAGTRFWPASRRSHPKQLLSLVGGEMLLAATVRRIAPIAQGEQLLIATGSQLVDVTLAATPSLTRAQLLVEPMARNTAPCIGWAATTIARRDPDAVVVVLPADQFIADEPAFLDTVRVAIDSAARGVITTIGIKPTHAETGYGYIEAVPASGRVWEVARFVEKPGRAQAEAFLAAGTFLWNAGMFVFRARDMLAAIRAHLPALADGLEHLDALAARGDEAAGLAELFATLPSSSIDTAVMEKLATLAVVPGDFGWSDVGSWLTAAELAEKDANGNSAPASAVFVGARDNHVVDLREDSAGRVIALVGVSGLVVVETADALLIVRREDSQRVREVVDALILRGRPGLV